jgi:hypothetical protein
MSGNSRSPGDSDDSRFSIDSNGTDVSEVGVGGEYATVGLGALSCVSSVTFLLWPPRYEDIGLVELGLMEGELNGGDDDRKL